MYIPLKLLIIYNFDDRLKVQGSLRVRPVEHIVQLDCSRIQFVAAKYGSEAGIHLVSEFHLSFETSAVDVVHGVDTAVAKGFNEFPRFCVGSVFSTADEEFGTVGRKR